MPQLLALATVSPGAIGIAPHGLTVRHDGQARPLHVVSFSRTGCAAAPPGCIPHFVRLRGLGVGVDPGLAGLVAEPEGGNWDGVAEVVGS